MKQNREAGFAILETLILLAVLLGVGFFLYTQWNYFQLVDRNTDRKTAINAMHYYLQEVYLPENDGYPGTLEPEGIKAISKDQLRDPAGRPISDYHSELRYQPGDCADGVCQRYTLRADLEQAKDFIRKSN